MTKVVCISDTHGFHPHIPDGDILIHTGDHSLRGNLAEATKFHSWFASLPHKYKVYCAGNHDHAIAPGGVGVHLPSEYENITYLQDSGIEIEGLKIYAAPWVPKFMNWAFNLPRAGAELAARWAAIPDDVDILMTHVPPMGIRDLTKNDEHIGCELLWARMQEVNPMIHAFGHVHEQWGCSKIRDTFYVNAAIMNRDCIPTNLPIVIDLGEHYGR